MHPRLSSFQILQYASRIASQSPIIGLKPCMQTRNLVIISSLRPMLSHLPSNSQFQIRCYAIKPVVTESLNLPKTKSSPQIVQGEVFNTTIRPRTQDNTPASRSSTPNNGSLDVARVAETDYILYEKRNPKFTQYATYIAAGSQLLCWFLFAELVYRYMEEAVERDENGDVKTKKSAPLAVRIVGSSLLMCVGILLAFGAHSYAKNTVKTLTLLQGGKEVLIETCNLIGRPKRVVSASNVALRDRVFTGYGTFASLVAMVYKI